MSAQPKPKPKRKIPRVHLEPQDGTQLATQALLRAVYMDDFERASAILAADPDQLNRQDPYAGLTPLHIAIFRQNADMVRLLAQHPACKGTIADNFGRTAADMLHYTSDRAIFDIVLRLASPDVDRSWQDEAFDRGRATGGVVQLRPRGDDKT